MKTSKPCSKVLIVRNDKLGDFMLIYPALALLKNSTENIHVTVLVPQYTADMAKVCPWVDNIIIDPGSNADFSEQYMLFKEFRKQKFDAIITLYSTTRIGFLAYLSRIKYRLAPATKIAQIFYNHRVTQRRSRSLKPEFEYNIDVIKEFLITHKINSLVFVEPPYLKFESDEVKQLHETFCKINNLSTQAKLIFIHPGTGGSANNLTIKQYADLIKILSQRQDVVFIITAGPGELDHAKSLATKLEKISFRIFHSTEGLINFAKHIQFCSLFISGSTGTLHIAGALDRPTAAFYQRLRSATPLRWQTLNSTANRLAFTPPDNASETDMAAIDITKSANKILKFYFRKDYKS